MALGTDYIIKYLSDTSDAIAGAKALEEFNKAIATSIGADYANMTKIVGTSFGKITGTPITINGQQVIKTVQDFTTVTKNAAGNFYELQGQITRIGKETQVTLTPALKDVNNQFTQTAIGAAKADKSFLSIGDNLIRVASRAVLTIPVWMALRSVMQGTIAVFTDGFKDLVNESLALDKVKNTLQGTANVIVANLEKVKNATESLAIESGVSHEKILATFQKFSSVGFDVETALLATNNAIKLSVITQSDATTSAESYAHALAVLIPTNASAAEKQKQVNDIMSLTSELWKTNGFNVEEFSGSLEKFSITAKSVNFTTGQTLALLATLSKSGLGSAGNLLRNSIGQLLVNLDKLAGTLGVKVNPQLDDTFSVLMKVLGQLDKLQKVNDLQGLESAKEALKEVFGGTRSAVPITALASLYDVLQKNIGLTGDINRFNDTFKSTEGVLANVVARFHTANSEIGKGFISGLIGGEDFNASLEKVNETLVKMQANAENFGKILAATVNPIKGLQNILDATPLNIQAKLDPGFTTKIQDQIVQALHGKSSKIDLATLFSTLLEVQSLKIDIGIPEKDIDTAINNIRQQLLNVKTETTAINNEAKKQLSTEKQVQDILIKKDEFLKLESYARKELSALGLSEVEVETRILELNKASNQFSEKELALQKELLSNLQSLEEIDLRRIRARGLIDNQLEVLRLQGATNLQVIQQRIELERMYGLNQTRADLLRNELEINKEITKEKNNQNKVSSDSLKLFQIAEKFGIQTATKASDFLSGKIPVQSLESFGSNSSLLPILKEFFASELEQRKAQAFLFNGLGTNIPIPERRAIQELQPARLSDINIPSIKTDIGSINVEIKKMFSDKDTSKQIIDAMLAAIRDNPSIQSAIDEKIDNF